MARYCIETQAGGNAVMHRVDCDAYDLGTLLGLGCVADLGEFATLTQALDVLKLGHSEARPCRECCSAQVLLLPRFPHYPLARAGVMPSG